MLSNSKLSYKILFFSLHSSIDELVTKNTEWPECQCSESCYDLFLCVRRWIQVCFRCLTHHCTHKHQAWPRGVSLDPEGLQECLTHKYIHRKTWLYKRTTWPIQRVSESIWREKKGTIIFFSSVLWKCIILIRSCYCSHLILSSLNIL